MASITYWNRLEPSPRSNDLIRPLAAPVRDPLWTLTRQWQFGEFRGADAGSPAWIEVDTAALPLTHWSPVPGRVEPLDPVPLETLLAERRSLDVATSVEIGQLFESLLEERGLSEFAAAFRAAYPLTRATALEAELGDDELLRFRDVTAGRGLDGAALYAEASIALAAGAFLSLRGIVLTPELIAVLQEIVDTVVDVINAGAPPEPSSWNEQHLDYELELVAAGVLNGIRCVADRNAEVAWTTLETSPTRRGLSGTPQRSIVTLLPANVRFRGMAPRRWWDFESSTIDFGAIDVERRDLARLVVNDLLQRQESDWFVLPIEQKAGTLLRIENVLVRDVFGIFTLVPPATPIFSISGDVAAAGRLLLPSASSYVQYGDPIEDVIFLRDEMLNLVWGIEEKTEGALGHALRGAERDASRTAAPLAPPPDAPPAYRLHTDVPKHWVPFAPVARDNGRVMLERMALFEPTGRLLRALIPPGTALRVAEEELRRSGLRLMRVPIRCRGFDGRTFVGVVRQKGTSAIRSAPLPRFDALTP